MKDYKINTMEGYSALRFPSNDGYVVVRVYKGRMRAVNINTIWTKKYRVWVPVQQIEDEVYQICAKHRMGDGLWFK